MQLLQLFPSVPTPPDGIRNVFLGFDYVTVTKHEENPWNIVKPEIFATIMDFFSSGLPVLTDGLPTSDTTDEDDDEVVLMIKELLGELREGD